jgi:site-specific DNA recombinase
MRVAIYTRVSTELQAEKGYSLDTQLEACRNYAIEMGATYMEEFRDDGYSGEYLDRPELTRLRESLKDFDVVVVYDPDRLARNLSHQLIITDDIEKAGLLLKFVSVNFEQSPEGNLFYSIRGAVSAYEKEKIKERFARGKRGKLKKGRIISDSKPFGHIYDKETSTYIINDDEAAIIRNIYDWCVNEKLGTAKIAVRLNEMGIVTHRAKSMWTPNAVYYVIVNPRNKGMHIGLKTKTTRVSLTKKKVTPRPEKDHIIVHVPPIVDEVIWQAAQKQLKLNRIQSKRNSKQVHALSGLVYCGKCGRKMRIEYSGRKPYPGYYACIGVTNPNFRYGASGPRCDARRIPSKILEEHIFSILPTMITASEVEKYADRPAKNDNSKNIQQSLDRLATREKELIQQRETVFKWFRTKVISETDATTQLNDINKQLGEIAGLKNNLINSITESTPKKTTKEIVKQIKSSFNGKDLSEEDKRDIIVGLLEKIIVERVDNTTARSSVPDISISLRFL